jgi:hypothetical protein
MNNLENKEKAASKDFKEFKKILNKLRNDERHAFQSDLHNEVKQIELIINDLKKKNPQFTIDYYKNLSAKAESNKKAAIAKQVENNEKTKQYITRKQQQENQNRKFLNGTSPTPQSSRAGYNGPAQGNKVPSYISPFAKRNRMGWYIDPNTGKPYPGQ